MDKALQQYLDLYVSNRELICSHSCHGMNLLRDKAFDSLSAVGLPKKGSENYELTDIPEMLAPDYGLNIARVPLDVDVLEGFRCGLPHFSSALFFQLNDRWGESKHARGLLPEGVEIGPLSRYLHEGGEALPFYGDLADLANPLVAFNSMLVQDGVFIRVRRGVNVECPVQFVNILEHTMPLMAVRRLLIVLEEGASLKFLSCDRTVSRDLDMAASVVTEIYAGRNSRLEFYDMEESTVQTRRLSSLYLSQEEGSEVTVGSFTLHNGMTRNEFNCRFKGPHSSLKLCGIGIENGNRLLDNYSYIDHAVGDCHTEELFKYIVEDDARSAFTGRVFVAPGASKTEAYQSNRNLLGSDRARVFSKPQLEIYNDDVKCSHGSATGQLDAMQLFYLRSRGLSEKEATLLLKQAFMADVVESVRLPELRERLHAIIERRFLGEDAACGDCAICR